MFAEEEAQLLAAEARTPAALASMVARRVGGEPLEQVLGWASFCGLRIAVAPGVFVPRRRSEFLVEQAAALLRSSARGGRRVVVDLCCGSGAIGRALAAVLGDVELHAVDVDDVAVACARRNLADVGGKVYQGDLYEPLPAQLQGRVDLVVANAPYVPTDEMHLLPADARLHEPRHALDGGGDGLDVLRGIVVAAPRWLGTGGHLLVETSQRQAPLLLRDVAAARLIARVATSGELGATVVIATSS